MPIWGNKYGVKLKDPAVRQEAYRQYCEHIAKGKSQRSFVFKFPVTREDGTIEELKCHWQTILSYIKDTDEFDPTQHQVALAQGYGRWEQVVEDSAEGANKDANTASLQMLMRNKFDWDRDPQNKESIEKALEALTRMRDSLLLPSQSVEADKAPAKDHSDSTKAS